MAVRTGMKPLIRRVRREIWDHGPTPIGENQYQPADTAKLQCSYYDLDTLALAAVTSPTVSIYDPVETLMVEDATPTSVSTGIEKYYYLVPAAGPEGIWNSHWEGTVGAKAASYDVPFEVKKYGTIFTDQEIQDFLDDNVFKKLDHEKMSYDKEQLVYVSPYRNLEDGVEIWDGSGSGASEISDSNYTEDLRRGWFTFSADQDDTYYISGTSYDLYGALQAAFTVLAGDPTKTRSWAQSGGSAMSRDDYIFMAMMYKNMRGARPAQAKRSFR